ncbi:XRE family transcriptional regulator [Lactobacillus sp. ESL0228]|nr:helix-turn-helix transcriptional regulator [Lactobacillus sp. ESL0228]RMC49558.1 XRE family transcriptional regulator [Lactobacillus sp. ESL0228]
MQNKYSKSDIYFGIIIIVKYQSLADEKEKVWKLLIDHGWKKKDLCAKSGISSASIAQLGKDGNVTTEVLLKICAALDCDISYIM